MTRCHECNQRPEDGCMFGCQTARAIEAEAERDALRTRAEEAERRLEEARALLREYQDRKCEGDYCGGCVECGAWGRACTPDCRLRALLDATQTPSPSPPR